MDTLITCIWAYIVGSIPSGYIIAKLNHIDIHKVGSGNIGATNIYRVLGLPAALLVMILDILKGFIPTFIAAHLLFHDQLSIGVVGLSTVIGHIFSIFMKFKGGKGVATSLGVIIVLAHWQLIAFLLVAWVVFLALIRIMSLVNLILILVLIPYFLFFEQSLSYALISLGIVILVWYSHRTNINKLVRGKEKRLQSKKKR